MYTKTETDNKLKDKADKQHGLHVPQTQTPSNSVFLRNDNTWQQVTPDNIGAPTKNGVGASGTWDINISGTAAKLQDWTLQQILDEIKSRSTQISILTGVLNDGGTIPLPDGYTETECKWMVSPKSDNYNWYPWDINENGGTQLIYTFYCYTEGRKVICRSRHVGDDGDRTFSGSVNYMIIGVK
nr:MAG TPA: hypothetical protein [Caudoviricetes sp.]